MLLEGDLAESLFDVRVGCCFTDFQYFIEFLIINLWAWFKVGM